MAKLAVDHMTDAQLWERLARVVSYILDDAAQGRLSRGKAELYRSQHAAVLQELRVRGTQLSLLA